MHQWETMPTSREKDSQRKRGAIGLLYDCSRVVLRYGADDNPCQTGGSCNRPRMWPCADNTRVMTLWNKMEFQYGSFLRVWTHFDGTMSSMCNGCRRLSVGVLTPRVLSPMTTVM